MQKTHFKKFYIFRLDSNKTRSHSILGLIGFLLFFNYKSTAQSNTAYGTDALKSVTTGGQNSAFGVQSLFFNTTGEKNTANGYQSLYSNTSGQSNTATGYFSLHNNSEGSSNTASGQSTLYSNTNGSYNTANGHQALYSNISGQKNTANGVEALFYNTGNYNTANGYRSLYSNTSGQNNTATGYQVLYFNTTGSSNVSNGVEALYSNTEGNFNTATGYRTLYSNTTGSDNIANGQNAMYMNSTGNHNTVIGSYALFSNTTGSSNTALGYQADVSSPNLTNATAIGSGAIANSSNTIQLGNSYVTQIFAGTGTNATLIAGGLQITGGAPAVNKVLTSDANGIAIWQNPDKSCWSLRGNSGINDSINFIGTTDNAAFNIRVNNEQSGRIDPKTLNASYGYQSSNSITTGNNNTAMGSKALSSNTTGNYNVALGGLALKTNATGSNNTAIGYAADVDMGLNNATAIGSKAKATVSNSIQLGNDTVTKVFVGVGNAATLVTGGLQITGSTPSTGKVLTSDANGRATWQTPNGWSLTGNSGINDSINFIGTTNDADVIFKRGNVIAGRLGNDNTAMGVEALINNKTGSFNTAVGVSALSQTITGSYNTAIGYMAGPDSVNAGSLDNTTAIGYMATTTASNQVRIGNPDVTSIGGAVGWTTVSDGRIKKDVKETVPGLEFIANLRPVTYHLDKDAIAKFLKTPDHLHSKNSEKEQLQTGFIAQEVEETADKIGFKFSGVDKPKNENSLYGLRYATLTVPLVKAVQEQQKQIDEQQKQIDELKKLVMDMTKNTNTTQKVITKSTASKVGK